MKLIRELKVKLKKGVYVLKIKKLFFAIIISSLWISGCSTDTGGMHKQVEENKNDFPPSMTGLINVNGKEYEIKSGNYRWERKIGLETEVALTDAASPYQIGENYNAIGLETNTNITIEIEENPKISVFRWNEKGRDKEIILTNNQFSAPSSIGRYIYEVLAEWSNGEVSYTFVVEVN